MARRVVQRHESLARRLPSCTDIVLHDRVGVPSMTDSLEVKVF